MKLSGIGTLLLLLPFGAAGQIVSHQLVAHYNFSAIQNVINGFGIPPGFLEPSSEVDFYRVRYMTLHPNGEAVEVSGALCVPSDLDCPLPMASYQHGTISRRTDAPSYSSGEGTVGVLFASAGYIVAMPDYIGLGTSELFHPYVHAASEATASADMIRAARDLQDVLNYEWDEQLFLFGYSQGGHATAALQRLIETTLNDEFQITASAPMSGPYDIAGVQADVLTSDEVYPTPGYLPYVVLSYQEVYGNIYTNLEEVFLPEYAAVIPGLFNGNTSMGTINNAFPDVPSQMLQPDFIEAYNNDPQHPMRLALQDNNTMDWVPAVPTQLFYCAADDQVNYMNSVVALETFTNAGSVSVEATNLGNYDHGDCAGPAFLFGFDFFEQNRVNHCEALEVMEAKEGLQVSFFPNPAEDRIRFGTSGDLRVEITDVFGRSVLLETVRGGSELSVRHLTSGVYLVRANGEMLGKLIRP